jgi:DNA-directed RNA polymerase specialized sigma24 family protein
MTEIAARLHISVAAVKSHLSHARSDLRRELEADIAMA